MNVVSNDTKFGGERVKYGTFFNSFENIENGAFATFDNAFNDKTS